MCVPTSEATLSRDLVERAQGGDHDAFEALVRPVYPRLFSIASRILRDTYAAEDAMQEAILGAWRDLRALRDADRFDAWIHRLVLNACRNSLRTARRRPVAVRTLDFDHPADDATPQRFADRDEIDRAFRRLSVDHRAVLVLTHYLGYSGPEIADLLGIPTGTVHSRLHHASASMRRAVQRPSLPTTAGMEQMP